MNENEAKFFSGEELKSYDATSLSAKVLVKALFVKLRRKTWGSLFDRPSRFVWTVGGTSDAIGPAANVRNYLEAQTIRRILSGVAKGYPVKRACEVGCGHGRLTMVLKEFAAEVVGFERERHLIEIGRRLLPDIEFHACPSLKDISSGPGEPFDLVMTCTVLQHLTDGFCRDVIGEIKRIAPRGHVLLIEKTEAVSITDNTEDGSAFLSRARPIGSYEAMMRPFRLVSAQDRVLEPTYFNPRPGTCMLFRSDKL